jgi:hypothetical protein
MDKLVSIAILLLVLSCSKDKALTQPQIEQPQIFEIYTADSVLEHKCCQPVPNDSFILSSKPIIGDSDFIFYDTLQNYLLLSASGKRNLASLVCGCSSGKVFAVCVNKIPIYNGQYRLDISSVPFDGPIINYYWRIDSSLDTLMIENGYPPSASSASDVRYNPQIIKALVSMGKTR